MLVFQFIIYIGSFIAIWAGSGLIVNSITKISRRIKIPSFFISFVILGMLTSSPELAVGLTSIASNKPSIFIGDLLGGIPVLFLLVIPLLAILGNGIRLQDELTADTIPVSLLVSLLPFVSVFDGKVTNTEAVLLIAGYVGGVLYLQFKEKLLGKKTQKLLKAKKYSYMDILKVLIGTAIMFVSSNLIVKNTIYFSEVFSIAPFYISLFALSFGTNLPELTIAFRSIFSGRKNIAFGDYLGSAAANSLLFGVFALMVQGTEIQVNDFRITFIIVWMGLVLFYIFAKSKRTISRREGLILLSIYFVFMLVELWGPFRTN